MPFNLAESDGSEVPEPSDHTHDALDRIATGRGFLRAHQPEAALREFEAAYDAGKAGLASSFTDACSPCCTTS